MSDGLSLNEVNLSLLILSPKHPVRQKGSSSWHSWTLHIFNEPIMWIRLIMPCQLVWLIFLDLLVLKWLMCEALFCFCFCFFLNQAFLNCMFQRIRVWGGVGWEQTSRLHLKIQVRLLMIFNACKRKQNSGFLLVTIKAIEAHNI